MTMKKIIFAALTFGLNLTLGLARAQSQVDIKDAWARPSVQG